ncbi:MAG: hypothetical protein GX774_08380 [Armatimonadetes bacterium]|nr:hypothetical protein [Armatimonadota bacterium]
MLPDPRQIAAAAILSGALLLPSHAAAQSARKPAAAPAKSAGRLLTHDTCTRVLEGDLIEGAKVGRIRLIGVIAPAKGEPGWRQSLDYTRQLVQGKQIKVEICAERPNDYLDRVRAVVYLPDATNLNTKVLRAGMARILDHRPCHVDVRAWQSYEAEARKARRGLWAEPAPGARVRIRPQR